MRRFFYYIFILIAVTELSTVMTSCRHSRTVAALVEADSLMWTRPDSSLALVRSVSPDTLDDENRAYHALLLTQAQFRNNIYPDTDTIINRALDFYADNHNRERLTRSLIYKGSVYEECKEPAEAMNCYIIAEENASPDDAVNLGIIFVRKGVLYRDCFSNYGEDIENFKKACYYLEKTGNKKMLIFCLSNIGASFREVNNDSAAYYLNKSLDIAYSINDTTDVLITLEILARMKNFEGKYREAKDMLTPLDLNYCRAVRNNLLVDLTMAYANLEMPDSARYYYSMLPREPKDSVESVIFRKSLVRVLASEGRYEEAYKLSLVAKDDENALLDNKDKTELFQTEKVYTKNKTNTFVKKISWLWTTLIVSIIVAVMLTLIFFILRIKSQTEIEKLTSLIAKRQSMITKSQLIKQKYVEKQIELIRKSLEIYVYLPDNLKTNTLKDGINISNDKSYLWESLYEYVNMRNNDILERLKSNGNNIDEFEIKIVTLMLCGLDSREIALCLGFNSDSSVRSRCSRIKGKLGISEKLIDYLTGNKKKVE